MKKGIHLYEFFFLAGIFGAVYLYAFHFDDFSETELVHVSYLWIAALTLGAHGIIASEVQALLDNGPATTHPEALEARKKLDPRSFLSRLSSVFLFSYLLVLSLFKSRRPFVLALAGMILWLLLLVIFLEGIFPGM